ncbi:MAG: DUF4296 domain-containing protein [Sphingobacteriales bacterium]|nr:DUF4296 domain-containing protein [Sphingobacteriales bacterium]
MRFSRFILILVLFITSCKNKNAVPSGILPPDKMRAVMWDMMRADQFLTGYVLNKDSGINKSDESLRYFQRVFMIHHLTHGEFQKSFSYYRSHPELFKIIMDSLSKTAGDAPTQMVNDPDKKDSLQTAPARSLPADTSFRLKRRKLSS